MYLVSDQPIVWPSLAITMLPILKDYSKYLEFMTKTENGDFEGENEYEDLVSEIFYKDPKDFILSLNMAKDYTSVMNNITRFSIEPPFVRTVLNDYIYQGFVAVISLEAIKNQLVQDGEMDIDHMGFSFEIVISLNVSLNLSYFKTFYDLLTFSFREPESLQTLNF